MAEKKEPVMTDEERLKLASKLDQELDEFIESLPRKKYQDVWPEDRWEEEMDKHPFFMKKMPEPGAELHPLYEGLQKLKYDPEENEPEELAVSYKDDGNFNFKHRNYRMAIISYTEGIKTNCGNCEILSNLYNNRSAAHYLLENYRSCLSDCELALKLKPDYWKCMKRSVNCLFKLKKYEKVIEYCAKFTEISGDNEILQLEKKSRQELKVVERNKRKMDMENRKMTEKTNSLLNEIVFKRGIKLDNLRNVEPKIPQLVENCVYLNADGNLVWPVVFLYPEYKIMDYIQEFNEIVPFQEQLSVMFDTFPEWDNDKKYVPHNLNIYFETDNVKLVKIGQNRILGDVLQSKFFVVKGGTPNFILLVKDSLAEKRFLENYSVLYTI